MHSNAKVALILSLLVLAIGVLFWPTLYRYDKLGEQSVPARINRVTGRVQVLSEGEWRDLGRERQERASNAAEMKLTESEQAKITGASGTLEYGVFTAPVHNGSVCTVTTMFVTVRMPTDNNRSFRNPVRIEPLSAGGMNFLTGTHPNAKDSYSMWWIDSAYGICPGNR